MLRIRSVEIKQFKGLTDVTIPECGPVTMFIGRNNSGKSSLLHALHIAGLALSTTNWDSFPLKLEMRDLIHDVGAFFLALTFTDGSRIELKSNARSDGNPSPTVSPRVREDQKFATLLVLAEAGSTLVRRRHRTPRDVINYVEAQNFNEVNALDILFALRYYGARRQRGFVPEDYTRIVDELRAYFPEIEEVASERTDQDLSTLTYKEYGRALDVLYSGAGLQHFLDIIVKASITRAGVLLLDEPEAGLHPDLQRRFFEYLVSVAERTGAQIFIATHSPLALALGERAVFYRAINMKGTRRIERIPAEALHTAMGDLGVRPSDLFNHDICLLVEGADDVVFFRHVIDDLYGPEFAGLAVGVVQYGGGAADGIVSGTISVANIVPAQRYTYWTRDRDAPKEDPPNPSAVRFQAALDREHIECHISANREVEFSIPEGVWVAAQAGDGAKEAAIRAIWNGDQRTKFRDAAHAAGCRVPRGQQMDALLQTHLKDRAMLSQEIRDVIETHLVPWARLLRGD